MRRIALLLLLAIAGFTAADRFGAGSSRPAREPAPRATVFGRVVSVTDGDTVRVLVDGARDDEPVRYIGIDTAERGDEPCFGRATDRNEQLVGGRRVRLAFDADLRDRYDRLLAYVYAGGVFVNRRLIAEGLAQPLTVEPNDRFAERFAREVPAAPRC